MEKTIVKRETGKRLKKLREALGYTQERMAEVLDVSVTLYKKMESGSYNISVKTLRKLKGFTGTSIDYLMFGEQKPYEDIWMQLQTADHSTKMKLLFRMIAYFGTNSSECFVDKEQEEEYSRFLDEWVKKYFSV
ncbi:MAG: helix-turn-helix transcriptional regulator [Lachnospiraceae bacterium]|nr:helix-turn-helix transcriptional regulator [Lachnospiraceae bacterium]